MQTISIILTILITAFATTLFGVGLLRWVFSERFVNLPRVLQVGLGYFFGTATFLAIWRVLALISGSARVPLYISIALIIFGAVYFWRKGFFWKVFVSHTALKAALLLVLTWCFVSFLWLQVLPVPNDPFDNFGSGSTGRYSNITQYIVSSNHIPVISQNYAQSMLASVPMFFGSHLSFFALNLWLSLSIFFLALTAYGLFDFFGFSRRLGYLAAFLFLFSNTALSFTHVLSLDSNSPFAMSSYIDATFSVVTFGILLVTLANVTLVDHWRKLLIVPAVLALYWNFSAPQNIILALVLLAVWFVYSLWRKTEHSARIFIFAGLFGLLAILGTAQGGMLSLKSLREKVFIPGVVDVAREGEYTGIKPELPFAIGYTRDWEYGTPYDPAEKSMYVSILRGGAGVSGATIQKIVWRLETNLWTAVRIMFFPLLGLVLFYILWRKGKIYVPQGGVERVEIWKYSSVVFAAGFLITFFIIVAGRKWEMSRFMINPYALGLFFWVFLLTWFLSVYAAKKKLRMLLVLVMIVMVIGPLANAAALIRRNIRVAPPVSEKFRVLTSDPGVVGADLWREWIRQGIVAE